MELGERVAAIEERNRSVALDKKWEVSLTRRSLIALLTYALVVIFLLIIEVPNPWLAALVQVIGYALSTLTLRIIKDLWIKNK